ncbi:hypothetical protein SGFS_058980 [Streptomyces graminofaciens]|uniref:Uncharacterized protein n=1 Tax=Streptomyces graminofaciens TaxID=68212 RepID=A0ABN5VMR3_9ACTN|nr:hypothetical protein SGFS_058980 [Streptomyces graminofaciens]
MAEVGAGQAQTDGGVGAESVAGLQDDETAPGAHEGGSGAQQFLEGVGERCRASQALREFMKGCEIRHPARESVLENGPRRGSRRGVRAGGVLGGRRGRWGVRGGWRRRDSVCGRGNR